MSLLFHPPPLVFSLCTLSHSHWATLPLMTLDLDLISGSPVNKQDQMMIHVVTYSFLSLSPLFFNLFIPLFLFLFFPLFPSSLVAVLAAALLSSSLNHVASFQKKEKKRKKERRCCIQMLLVDSFFRPLSLQLLFEEVDIEKRRRTAIMYQL